MIELINLTTLTIPLDPKKNLFMRIGNFPARYCWKTEGGTVGVGIFRTTQNDPAWIFPVPEI